MTRWLGAGLPLWIGGLTTVMAQTDGTPANTMAIHRLEPVIVSATRMDTTVLQTPASVSVIEGYDMRHARPGVNVSESLGGVPGLQIQNRENYAQDLQISVRGFGARSTFGVRGVRLYVDGIPGTMPDGQGQTSNIDIASIERVEVLRGPFSALYGNSSGGVIQVFTEDGKHPPELSASLMAGSHGARRYGSKARGLVGIGETDLDYVVSVNRFTTDGFRDHSQASRNQGNAKLGLQLDDATRLTLVVNSVSVKADDPLGLARDAFDTTPEAAVANATLYNTRKSVDQTQGGLVFDKQLDDGNALRAMVYYGERSMEQYLAIPPAAQRNSQHSGGVINLDRRYAGADVRWTSRQQLAGQPLTLVAGLAYDELREDRRGYENFTGSALGVKGALRRDETNKVWNIDPYLQASWQFAPRWTVDAGVRHSHIQFDSNDHFMNAGNLDDSGSAGYSEWLPVGSLRFAVTDDITTYVTAGRGFETPTFNELSYRDDGLPGLNFDLNPSINTSLEIGVKARVARGILSAALYQTQARDEIVTSDARFGRTTYQNAGRTRRNGFELAWAGDLVQNLRAQLAYGWLDARYRDDCTTPSCTDAGSPDKHLRAGHRIPGIARHAFYASLDWQPETGFQAGIDARFTSAIQVNDGNTETAPAYFTTGVHTGYIWRNGPWRISSYARIDNVFDRRYAGSVIVNDGNQRYYEPAPGRHWNAGLDVSFVF